MANRSLYLVAGLRALGQSHLPLTPLAMVHIPGHVVPRFISLPAQSGQYVFILLEDVLQHYLPRLYQGYEILSCHAVRVTRDADFELPEDRLQDMLTSIEEAMRERRMGHRRTAPVRHRPAGKHCVSVSARTRPPAV